MADQEAGAQVSDLTAIRDLQLELMRGTGMDRRGQHSKAHGVVWAEFEVLDNIPKDLRVGLFGQPATYVAYIRFSNGGQEDDSHNQIQGSPLAARYWDQVP